MMEVFICQPMERLTNNEIKQRRSKFLDMIKRRYPTEEIRFIANPPYPYDCNSSIWFLIKSLEYITLADLVFFSKYWEIDYICSLEHAICRYYNIPILHEKEITK